MVMFLNPDIIISFLLILLEEDIVFQRHYGWVIYAQCDVPGVEEDEVTIFLAMTLTQKTPQVEGVKVMHPVEGSNCDRVWNPDEEIE